MNKNNTKYILLVGLFAFCTQIFAYVPVYKQALQEYVDPMKTQSASKITRADLRGANIGKIVMKGGSFSGVRAEKCQPGDNSSKYAVCVPTNPTIFANSQFLNVNLSGSNFSEAVMSGVNFTGSNAWKAIFRGADLRNTKWTNVRVNFTDFSGANLTGATGLQTLQDDAPGSTCFCNATMPDGTVCTSGTVWNNQIDCNCPDTSSSANSGSSTNS